jgi:hypothetical protein
MARAEDIIDYWWQSLRQEVFILFVRQSLELFEDLGNILL